MQAGTRGLTGVPHVSLSDQAAALLPRTQPSRLQPEQPLPARLISREQQRQQGVKTREGSLSPSPPETRAGRAVRNSLLPPEAQVHTGGRADTRGGRFHGLHRTRPWASSRAPGPSVRGGHSHCRPGLSSHPPPPRKNRASHSGTAPTSAWHTPTHGCVQLQLRKPRPTQP